MKEFDKEKALNIIKNKMPDSTAAMLVIAADEDFQGKVMMLGFDPLGISKPCVCIAGALNDVLDGKLAVANMMLKRILDNCATTERTGYKDCDNEDDSDYELDFDSFKESMSNIMRYFVDELIDFGECTSKRRGNRK